MKPVKTAFRPALALLPLLLASCFSDQSPGTVVSGNAARTGVASADSSTIRIRDDGGDGEVVTAPLMSAIAQVQCLARDPLLALGAGRDAPVVTEGETPFRAPPSATVLNGGACATNTEFRMGSAITDITGSAGGSITTGYENPEHQTRGIHTRQYSRAFALHSPCNDKRVLMAVVDNAFITQAVRQGVVQAIAADPELKSLYGADNIMLSATHTHSAPGGDAHDTSYNAFRLGFDELHYRIYVNGIVKSLKAAHRNLQANAASGKLGLSVGSLLDTNTNRSLEAFRLNPAEERSSWQDAKGRDVDVNKRMVMLRMVRNDGSLPGFINWFGVHTTSLGIHVPAVGSDNKGFAALTAERIMGTRYGLGKGENTFVAAFAQADEGDSSPNVCFDRHPFPDVRIGCGRDTEESNAASGTKQLKAALDLFDKANRPVRGGIDYQLIHVDMTRIEVKDPEVLKRLKHPKSLDSAVKRTCTGGAGVSFGAGAEDNRGHTEEGVTCANRDRVDQASRDVRSAYDNAFQGYYDIPPFLLSNALCAANAAPGRGDYSCQAEKPVLFPIASTVLPLQIVTIGNLAVVGLPFEVTTAAARRLRALMLDTLAPGGVDHVVIAGLSNDYANYLSTREEYASQQYEGASTLFGPWQLAAVMQETRRMALALRDGRSTDKGAARVTTPELPRPPQLIADTPLPSGRYGAVIQDVKAAYQRGQTVVARFQGGHPRNDTEAMLEKSYATVERQLPDGRWVVHAEDRLPEVQFRWNPVAHPQVPVSSENEVAWSIPFDAPAGRYRLKHEGAARAGNAAPVQRYVGISGVFEIAGQPGSCARIP